MQDGVSSRTQLRPSSKENSRAVLLLNRKLSHEIANRPLYWSYQAVHFLPGWSNIKNNHLRISDISVSFCQQLLLKMSGVNENILPLQLWAWTGQWAGLWDLQPLRKRRGTGGLALKLKYSQSVDSTEESWRKPGSHADSSTETGEVKARARRQLHDAAVYRPGCLQCKCKLESSFK